MIGAAVAGAGQNLVHAAYNLNDLQAQEKADVLNDKSNTVSTALNKFLNDEEQRFLKSRDESSESGIGFTRQFMEGYQQRADAFAKSNFEGLNDDAQTGYLNNILTRGNSLFEKATAYENAAKGDYYDRSTKQSLDGIRTQIGANSAPYEDLKKQGLAAIDATNMPETWKADRRARWDSDAAESRWKWKFADDPRNALRDIKGGIKVDAKGLANSITQTANQLGVSPNDIATVISYETGGTFDPWQKGPVTKYGEHRGLIQWGEPQRAKYGVTADMPIEQQVAAVGRYLKDAGVKPGMGLIDIYSAINAGAPGLYDRSDYKAGGAPGTVADKVKYQMEGHKAKAAALLGGTYTPTIGDPDLDKIPYERREQLYRQGETDYAQELTRQRTAVKDDFSLQIAQNPTPKLETQILANSVIDNGDKATLINALHTAVKENAGVPELINAIGAGKGSINAFDTEQTKVAEKAYDQMTTGRSDDDRQTITSGFIAQTGYIPKKVQADLRRGAISTDTAVVAQSMEAASVLQKNAPASFTAMDGSAAVQKKLDLYKSYTGLMGYSPDEAAKKIIAADDPEAVKTRDALLNSKSIKDILKNVDASSIASNFDNSFAGLARNAAVGGNATADQVKVGVNSDAEAAIVADYRSILQEALVDTNGNEAAARDIANKRFGRSYAPSEFTPFGSNVIVKNPPETAYPAGPDGTHGYIREQLADAFKETGIHTDEFYLQADQNTDKDIKAGRPASYRVFYKSDGRLNLFPYPFHADVEAAKQKGKEKLEQQIQTSRQRMIQNRDRTVKEHNAVNEAIDNTVGPDWMKARAAETAQEKLRMQEMMPGPINPSTADQGGGGGGF
ncbi:hypothetical protein QTL95_27040 [Rhizobium sp. S152]|uniref:hypothetical protein n=1 Tax=Rhizobium sp. S152 TaxID=3055038 RepID=UPI0025A9E6D3|nr:hypothetical protein [Rhizobium sp. S152]MDM9629545.1 hypothetical protein [Rhizobium sp. S152]